MHSQQLAKSAAEAVEGNNTAFVQLGDSAGIIGDAVVTLKNGDPRRSLPALPRGLSETLSGLDKVWVRMQVNANSILDRETLVLELADAIGASSFGVVGHDLGAMVAYAVAALAVVARLTSWSSMPR